MATNRLSNPLALAVLTLLMEGPMHPYEMAAKLRERRKEDSIKLNYGSLYAVVDSLLKRRLISVHDTVREGNRPERTIYAITDEGTVHMATWLSDLISKPEKEFPVFEAALSLMPVLPPQEVAGLLKQRLTRLELEHRTYVAMRDQSLGSGFPRLLMIEWEYAFTLVEAEIGFLRGLIKELDDGTLDGLAYWQRMSELRAAGASQQEIETTLAGEFGDTLPWLGQGQADG